MNTTNTSEPLDDIELHDKGVNEILGDPPSWLTKTGGYMVYVVLLFLVTGVSFIKSPDLIESSISIRDYNHIHYIISKHNGIIDSILVNDGSKVEVNQTIAIFESGANYEDIINLNNWILNYEIDTNFEDIVSLYHNNINIGSLTYEYLNILHNIIDYQKAKNGSYLSKKKLLLEKEISILKETKPDNQLDIVKTYSQIVDLEYNHKKDLDQKKSSIITSILNLKADFSIFLFEKTIQNDVSNGIINIPHWYAGRKVSAGDTICSIIDNDKKGLDNIQCAIVLRYTEISNIAENQKVKIDIFEYPSNTYGYIMGKVKQIEYLENEENYIIYVELPNPLITTHDYKIEVNKTLHGRAEILLQEKTLMSRFIEPILKLKN